MNKRMKGKRILVMTAMALTVSGVLFFGLWFLVKHSQAAISSMSYKEYASWTGNEGNTIGEVVDANGQVLWSVDFAGFEDTYSLIGNPQTPLNENVVAVRKQGELFGCDDYNIFQGVDSLKETGQDIQVTLDHERNSALYYYMKENGVKKGSVLAVDGSTGAVRVCVSLPAADPSQSVEEMEDGALLNRNMASTISGSTIKPIVAMLLAEQSENLEAERYVCTGSHELKDGSVVTCITKQGTHDIKSALGVSCNGYFASMINKYLDPNKEEVKERLNELGFVVGDGKKKTAEVLDESGILYRKSSVNYTGNGGFASTWSLIGEGEIQISPLHMVKLVSAIVHEGKAADPYLLTAVNGVKTHYGRQEQLFEEEVAKKVYEIWKSAKEEHYSENDYAKEITAAKTGTAEYDNGTSSKLLVGYIEKTDEVFFIEICDYDGSLHPAEVANLLVKD